MHAWMVLYIIRLLQDEDEDEDENGDGEDHR